MRVTIDSFSKAAQQVQQMVRNVRSDTIGLLDDCASAAETASKAAAPVLDGTLSNSITAMRSGEMERKVRAGAYYAAYVTFGTGIIGGTAGNQPTDTNGRTWEYDVNNHGPDGWTWHNKTTGRSGHTAGRVPNPYMEQGAQELQNQFRELAARRFGK